MNKGELINAIAYEMKISKADAAKAIDGFINASSKALKKRERIQLTGFGSFSVAKRAARSGRNPRTGDLIKIPARDVVKFKAGSGLKKSKLQKKIKQVKIARAIATETKLSTKVTSDVLDGFIKITTKVLKRGEKVALLGFGTFTVAKRAARSGRNPQTGRVLNIPAKNVVRFKVGTEFKRKTGTNGGNDPGPRLK